MAEAGINPIVTDNLPPTAQIVRSPSLFKSRCGGDLKVATFGQEGSLSHQALMSIFDGDEKLQVKHCRSFESIFQLIAKGDCHSGVVPIENTSLGPMPGIYDLILKYPAIKIIGEHIKVEDHCLCAPAGTKTEDIDQIVAHPWAGAQCKTFLERMELNAKNGITRVLAPDTAAACKMALERQNTATIQSSTMAGKLGLKVLAAGISDDAENRTRFVLLSKEEISLPLFENTSTTIAFALENKPNSMFKALAVFALRDIAVRRMVTRPTSQASGLLKAEVRLQWEYFIILDIEGHPNHDPAVAAAIAALSEFCIACRVLGSYRISQDRKTIARKRFDSVVETMRGAW
jgi:chorismate mutase/prephenate dehydratase